ITAVGAGWQAPWGGTDAPAHNLLRGLGREGPVGAPAPTRTKTSAARQANARTRPLPAHLLAELEELRRTPAGRGRAPAGPFHEPSLLDEPAEVLLMHSQPDQRLDGPLQLRERKRLRH